MHHYLFRKSYCPLTIWISCAIVACAGISTRVSRAEAPVNAATAVSPDGLWEIVDERVAEAQEGPVPTPWIRPDVFRLVTLNQAALVQTLTRTPSETAATALAGQVEINLPMPDGTFQRFRIAESPIMAAQLAAKFPQIKTYIGQGLEDKAATLRFDWTPSGFHAQVLSPAGAVHIDPYWKGDTTVAPARVAGAVAGGASPSGPELRTYRLACAATGEYTQFHGGTRAAGMAAIVTAINRVTGIYEVEVAARMVLVGNNDLLVYTNSATDPYSNGSGFAMLDQNQANLSAVIGNANYDFGHVFSTGGGGVAGLSVICRSSNKAWGVTGQFSPIGDPFWVDYVAHEMGHQFGGSHTFNGTNGSCGGNRTGSTAYEPGSGSTIQAYAGICGPDDLQPHSDPYFHSLSFDEIRNCITNGFGNSCAVVTATGNDPPFVDAGPDVTIPAGTPFVLTASGGDVNGDAVTYNWEERDLGPAAPLSAPDNGSIPLFRSFNATPEPERFFPRLSDLVNGTTSQAEKLPTTNRTMTFRATVRDNRTGGGGVNWDEKKVAVDAGSGPFRVTAPTEAITTAGDIEVTWDVAGTDSPPVNVATVNILLSIDGGYTFPTMLVSNTPNDGSETVTIGDLGKDAGQLKVEAVGNVFFALSRSCLPPSPATPEPNAKPKNRYLSFLPSAGENRAIRITFTRLPEPFDVFDGLSMWVGATTDVSENGGSLAPVAGFPDFRAATLQCDPFVTNWGAGKSGSAAGVVHVSHRAIVPGGDYVIQMVDGVCAALGDSGLSTPLAMTTSRSGDLVGPFDRSQDEWSAPDGAVDVTADVVALLSKFVSQPGAPTKARADLEPATPDRVINITDVAFALDAFRGLGYPFEPGPAPCGSK